MDLRDVWDDVFQNRAPTVESKPVVQNVEDPVFRQLEGVKDHLVTFVRIQTGPFDGDFILVTGLWVKGPE